MIVPGTEATMAAVFGWGAVGLGRAVERNLDQILDHRWLAVLARPSGRPAPTRRWAELVAVAMAVAATGLWPAGAAAAVLVLAAGVGIAAWVDSRHGVIPDLLTAPLIVLGLAASFLAAPLVGGAAALAGAIVGAGCGLVVRWLGALGRGDVKLLAAIGAWLGPLAVVTVLLTASLLMMGYLGWRARRGGIGQTPFGPAIACGLVLVLPMSQAAFLN